MEWFYFFGGFIVGANVGAVLISIFAVNPREDD